MPDKTKHEIIEMKNRDEIKEELKGTKEDLETKKKACERALEVLVLDPEKKEDFKKELEQVKKDLLAINAYENVFNKMNAVTVDDSTKKRKQAVEDFSNYLKDESETIKNLLESSSNSELSMGKFRQHLAAVDKIRQDLVDSMQGEKEGKKNRILTKRNFIITTTISTLVLFLGGLGGASLSKLIDVNKTDSDPDDPTKSYNKLELYLDSLREDIQNEKIDMKTIWNEFGHTLDTTTPPITIEEQLNALAMLQYLIYNPNEDANTAVDILALSPSLMQDKSNELYSQYKSNNPPKFSSLYYCAANLTYNRSSTEVLSVPASLVITLLMLVLQKINYELHHTETHSLLSTNSNRIWSKKGEEGSKEEEKEEEKEVSITTLDMQ